jgi:hypothetical protein
MLDFVSMAHAQQDRGSGRRLRPGAPGRDMTYHRLLEALAEPDCPVCALRSAAVHRYLEGILYESVNDVGLRHTLVRSRGFCREHAWELAAFGDSLATAILYKDQVVEAIEDLRQARGRSGTPRGAGRTRRPDAAGPAVLVRRRRTPDAPCPACRIADEATGRYLSALIQHIDSPELRQAIDRSAFLCLPDVLRTLELAAGSDPARVILDIAEAKLAALHQDLAELIRKRDYRFAQEPKGAEQTSWLRAIGQLVGWVRGRRRG